LRESLKPAKLVKVRVGESVERGVKRTGSEMWRNVIKAGVLWKRNKGCGKMNKLLAEPRNPG
jgi:hypothetical protein